MRARGLRSRNLDGGGKTIMTACGSSVTRPTHATGERPIGDPIVVAPR